MMNLSNVQGVLTQLANKAKALALNVTETELKVLDATNEEPWGPHGKDMQEIARMAEDPEKYNLIMNVISERLQMRDENWRLCYKALLLLEFLVKHGPWRVVDELNRSVSSLERLRDNFEYKDPQGKDQGINVRQRAGELAGLVSNIDRVRQEREKAAKNANKFKGMSSNDVRFGGGGSAYGMSGFGSGGGGFGGGGSGYGSGGGGGGGSGGFGRGDSGGFGSSAYGGGGFGGGGDGGGMGQRSGGAYGSTESVHVRGGVHNRTSSSGRGGTAAVPHSRSGDLGGDGFSNFQGGADGGEGGEDPYEATRKRIERLKAEGALADAGGASASAGLAPGLVDPAAANKQPKKLKDVKINPAVAATFASISIAPPPSAPSVAAKLAPPPPAGAKVHMHAPGHSALDDLFGGAAPASSSGGGAPAAAPAASSDWDAFGGMSAPAAAPAPAAARPAPAVTDDPFGDFASSRVPAPAPAPAPAASSSAGGSAGFDAFDPFTSAPPPASAAAASRPAAAAPAPAPSAPAGRAALPEDLFAMPEPTAAPPPRVAAPSGGAAAPSGGLVLPPAPAADPFAALAGTNGIGSTGMRGAPLGRPTGPTTATHATTPTFDAFGSSAAPPPVRPPAAASSDPFSTLATSSAAPSRPAPAPAPAAASTFDPFAPAPSTFGSSHSASAGAAPAAFDAFGMSAPAPAARPAPAADPFADPFAARPAAAATMSGGGGFPAPPAPAHTASGGGASAGVAVAMNKAGVAHGSAGHKPHDPFAGLGF